MGIIRQVNNIIKRNTPKEVAEEVAETYIEKKENGEEHPIDTTVELLMQKIRENPDPEKIKRLLIEINKQEQIPDRIFEKASTKILQEKEIPNRIITEVVKSESEDISDKSINTIIEEGNVGLNQRIELIKNVSDDNIIEKRIETELKILYSNCKEKREGDIVERVEELKDLLNTDLSKKIQNLIQKVVAKKMAENYYDDTSKGTKIYTLSKIVPLEEMMEIDLPQMVFDEYRKIEQTNGEKPGRMDVSYLRSQILDKMAKGIVDTNKKTGIYVIPQSESMQNLTIEEEEKFVSDIKKYSNNELTEDDVFNIRNQIHGNEVQIKENELITLIKQLPEIDKKDTIDFFIKILKSKEYLRTMTELNDSGLLEDFNKMNENRRVKTIETIANTINNRKYKASGYSPKVDETKKYVIQKGQDR